MKPLLISVFVALLANSSVQAGLIHFQSPDKQVSLLELYTSEGCSSCPRAEAWLAGQVKSPRLWRDFVPVAFHVDYWNYLGWKDQWSDAGYSLRQQQYAQAWHRENIYTPCFVVNGKEWGSNFLGRSLPKPAARSVGILAVQSTDTNHWELTFAPTDAPQGNYEIHAALLGGGIQSAIKAGENAGRTLRHEFVALDLLQIGARTEKDIVRGKFIINSAAPAEKTLALAVWITKAGEMEPLQATGGWIKK